MIFSLSEKNQSALIKEISETDIFCFFHSQGSVQIPENFLWSGVLASLKLKKNVLILEENLAQIPTLGSARWLVGERFLYLAPRASSVLLEAIFQNSGVYSVIKTHLTTFK